MATTKKQSPDRRRIGTANSIPGAAEKADVPEKILREAIKRGQVKTIPFGGLHWVPDSEIERVKGLLAQ